MIGHSRSSLAAKAPMPTPARKHPCDRCGRRAEDYHDGRPYCGPCLDAEQCLHESCTLVHRDSVEPVEGVGGYAVRAECDDCDATVDWHELPGGERVDVDVLEVRADA